MVERKKPQVTGTMERLADRRSRTGRLTSKNAASSAARASHSGPDSGLEPDATRRTRRSPAISRNTKRKKTKPHIEARKYGSMLCVGIRTAVVAGGVDVGARPVVRAIWEPQRAAASPREAEYRGGTRLASSGSSSAPRIPATHTRCLWAADWRFNTHAATQESPRTRVTLMMTMQSGE